MRDPFGDGVEDYLHVAVMCGRTMTKLKGLKEED